MSLGSPHGPGEAGPLGPSSSDFSIHHLRAGGTFETKTPRSSGIAGESEAWAGGVRLTVAQPPGRSRGGVSVRTRLCVHASVRISVHGGGERGTESPSSLSQITPESPLTSRVELKINGLAR